MKFANGSRLVIVMVLSYVDGIWAVVVVRCEHPHSGEEYPRVSFPGAYFESHP